MIIFAKTKNRHFQVYNLPMRPTQIDSYVAARDKLESFGTLPAGWNYGRGRRIATDVVLKAIGFLELAYNLGFRTFETFPGTDGGLLISMYASNQDVEVRVNSNLSVRVVHDQDGNDLQYRDNLSNEDAVLLLTTIAATVCSFASSTHGISVLIGLDSLVRLSNPQAMAASLFLMPTAPNLPQGQFATTYTSTIEESQESPRYFGDFTRVSSHQVPSTLSKSTKSRLIRATRT